MSDLTDKFTVLEEQMTTQQAETIAALTDITDILSLLNTSLDTLNNNGATNTRLLLAALGAINPCAPCPTPALDVPPTDTAGVAIDSDHCKRVQAFLQAMARIFTVLDTISAFAIPFNPGLIIDAWGQVIVALENGDDTPLPSYPEAMQIVGTGINYAAGNFLVGGTLSEDFASVRAALQGGMYGSTTAAAAQSSYNGIIDASSVPSYAKPLMKAAAYNALYSYYFDPASDPNLTGLSGTACSAPLVDIVECVELTSHEYITGSDHYQVCVADPVYSGNPIFTAGNFNGFTFEVLELTGGTEVRLDYYNPDTSYSNGSLLIVATGIVTMTAVTAAIGMHQNFPNTGGGFVIRVCPPA
jgi:hypothetical protein